ncbi:mitochondrial import receptor subunit Tom40 homolog [Plasmodium yoelii]|uniref:Mitochondrial import receptor subunit TOM40 n=3 Tax=Plasmodium yoelii TaxID=5861 RepID=A0AAE9WU08_PLAYO|nr:mitochondrial import receptor subunit Tom40 homolog [Plasmodium yoelii]EAA17228.1 probable mitochondrial import receptor subunit tom40 homolog [Plasmodium yoelii yoelii]WBY58565.1 mitochondrial import receptor subunit TOM40 [Plasmodium yoelii yoelii]CDU18868.1 mitochondrial import receptor subunit TOM40, putative [Plasmodium yoelii]VTZ79453.1 mitochondrial import receptor subunit TOM40, putative [Plasmodium yoelii]|eukprot:XP_725663.1 mitochondrial import receptor subunit Tom40 homolog [Plasmodium yoelii]
MEITNTLKKLFRQNFTYIEGNSIFETQQKKDEKLNRKKGKLLNNKLLTLCEEIKETENIQKPKYGDIENINDIEKNKQNEGDDKNSKDPNLTPFINTFDAPNALLFENLNKEYKYITTQDNFDGFRFEVDKNVNKYLQSTHTLFLGTSLRDVGYLYQFGANFANSDNTLLMISRINLDGSVNGRFCKKINNFVDCKFNFNTYNKSDPRNMYEMSLEVNNPQNTYNIKTIWQGAWIFNASYTQLLTKKLQAGVDLTYIGSNCASIGSFGLRYNHKNHVLTMQCIRQPNFKSPEFMLNQAHSYKMQYARKISDRLSVGTELEVTPETKESAMRLGWDYSFRHAKVQGSIDSSGKIAVFTQDYSGFGVSGYIDYLNNEYKFGFMMHIAPSQEQPQPQPQ